MNDRLWTRRRPDWRCPRLASLALWASEAGRESLPTYTFTRSPARSHPDLLEKQGTRKHGIPPAPMRDSNRKHIS